MLLDNYIIGVEKENICSRYANYIFKFSKVRERLKSWYLKFDFEYQDSCDNNLRDSWFHYRKIYQENSAYELVCQIAAYKEHLQRAEKDALIYFLQKMCSLLEFWYLNAEQLEKIHEFDCIGEARLLQEFDQIMKNGNGDWTLQIAKSFGKEKEKLVGAYICIFQKKIRNEQFISELQNVLHEIKNIILDMRVGGADIYRIHEPGEYLDECEPCMEAVLSFCEKYKIKNLLSLTEQIKIVLETNKAKCVS